MSALAGLLVLDFTRHLPGPWVGQLLADFGATVVKVEDRAGDPVRHLPPFDAAGTSVAFGTLNSGKQSLGIDLKHPEGKDVALRLASQADVLLDGFRPGVLDRLGLGFDAVHARNRGIVYASLSGFGASGPYATRAGHDLNYEALAGALAHAPPGAPSLQLADMSGALALANGVLLALVARARSGEGQRVATSLFGATVALQPFTITAAARGETSAAAEALDGRSPCYRTYATRDGRTVALAALEPQFWESFCGILDRPDWLSRHYDPSLVPELERLFASKSLDEWRLLEDSECCLTAVSRPEEVARDPQVEASQLIVRDETGRAVRLGPPCALSGTPARPGTRAPARGVDTVAVLQERLGLDETKVRSLLAGGAIFQAT